VTFSIIDQERNADCCREPRPRACIELMYVRSFATRDAQLILINQSHSAAI